ncbi:hypothetical protein Dimus_034462 [Dionaea muscipula]
MEKRNTPNDKMPFKFLPRAASAINFRNPKLSSTKQSIGFSHEPTTPKKVTWMGQIKQKLKLKLKIMIKEKSKMSIPDPDLDHGTAKREKEIANSKGLCESELADEKSCCGHGGDDVVVQIPCLAKLKVVVGREVASNGMKRKEINLWERRTKSMSMASHPSTS